MKLKKPGKSINTGRSRRTSRLYARILRKAIHLFSVKGGGQVSLGDITAQLGITQPAIYYYFKNRLALYQAVFNKAVGEFENTEEAALNIPGTLSAKLAALLTAYSRMHKASPELMKAMCMILYAPPPEISNAQISTFHHKRRTRLEHALKECLAEGGIPKRNFKAAAYLADGLLFHFMAHSRGEYRPRQSLAPRQLAEIISTGLYCSK